MTRPVVSWRVAADNRLDAVGVTNTLDLTNPADATVTVTVRKGANGSGPIVTGLNAIPATYVPGTTGPNVTYRTLAATAAVTPPIGFYEAEIVATKGGVTGREFATINVKKG